MKYIDVESMLILIPKRGLTVKIEKEYTYLTIDLELELYPTTTLQMYCLLVDVYDGVGKII